MRPPAIRTAVTGTRKVRKPITLAIQADDGGGSGIVRGTVVRWGDGTKSTGLRLRHTYATPGRKNVFITVRDAAGNRKTYLIFIRITR